MEEVPLTITLATHWQKHLLLVPRTLCSPSLEVLVSKGEILPPGDTTIPLNWKRRLLPGHVGFFMTLNQQAKKGNPCAGWLNDPDRSGRLDDYYMMEST